MSRSMKYLPCLLLGAVLVAQTPALEAVLRAELSFARLVDGKGIRTAFRTWLVEDARVFTPKPVTAKEQYGPEPGDPGHLAWYPEAMGLAQSGDLAWSFGPWTYAVKKGDPVLVQGHFLSIWRRQATGLWRVEADIGVPHGAPERPADPFALWDAPAVPKPPAVKGPDAAANLRQKEVTLAAAWKLQGGVALLPELAREGRVLRARALPTRSLAEARAALGADLAGTSWDPGRIQIASSGDLAWTWGEAGPGDGPSTASYFRIWTLESGLWKVLFDVRLPYPATSK